MLSTYHVGRWVLAVLLAVASLSCGTGTSPTQPTQTAPGVPLSLAHFEELVGTAWTGTATFATTDGSSAVSHVEMAFLWLGVIDMPYWGVAQGYNSFGWGTIDDLRTRLRGYNAMFKEGVYNRNIDVGENPVRGTGTWQTASLAADRQRLRITSSDFVWNGRRAVTFELVRTPWPSDVNCPAFRTCGSY
jgi:hypothetical protein